jgi:hypothetical protein
VKQVFISGVNPHHGFFARQFRDADGERIGNRNLAAMPEQLRHGWNSGHREQ